MEQKTKIAFDLIGVPVDAAPCLVVWGHGWGMDRDAFRPMAETLAQRAAHMLVDFPGFGNSPLPPQGWGTAEYADALADMVGAYRGIQKIIWVGHSFGCRVGIQMAARHPQLLDGLFLVAAAGLRRRRSYAQRLKMSGKIIAFKGLKKLAPLVGVPVDDLRKKFGSADYQAAGALRPVFLKVVREDLSQQARQIKCSVQLVYGAEDSETPPEIGERLEKLIPNAALSILPAQDHYTVLGAGRHIVIKRLSDFMESLR